MPNMIWDADNNKPLCKFVKGQLTTNDEVLVAKLTELGCKVSGEADKAPDAPAAPKADEDGGTKESEKTNPPTDGDDSATGPENDEPAKVETPVETSKADEPAATTTKRRSRK